jgi:hypothetical protein
MPVRLAELPICVGEQDNRGSTDVHTEPELGLTIAVGFRAALYDKIWRWSDRRRFISHWHLAIPVRRKRDRAALYQWRHHSVRVAGRGDQPRHGDSTGCASRSISTTKSCGRRATAAIGTMRALRRRTRPPIPAASIFPASPARRAPAPLCALIATSLEQAANGIC